VNDEHRYVAVERKIFGDTGLEDGLKDVAVAMVQHNAICLFVFEEEGQAFEYKRVVAYIT
jgi:hypothetical protein